MKNYSQWKTKESSPAALLLDTGNPRIPDTGKQMTQREIIAELIEHESVYELARSIATQGYFPTEVLVATEEDGETVVLEGNRRLAAVKLLISPELAPEEEVPRFRRLHNRAPLDQVRKLDVVIAPSREAAAPLIMRRHTRTGVERWKPAQQAKYVHTLLRVGTPLDDIAEDLGVTKGELLENLRTHSMYQVACSLPLPENVGEIVRNPREFNASALERLVDSPKTRDFLGVSFDDRGELVGSIHPDEFKKAFSKIVTDIATTQIDTRIVNKADQIAKYLKRFGPSAPDRTKKGKFTSSSLLGGAKVVAVSAARKSQRPKATQPKKSTSLVPRGFKCTVTNHRINEVFEELKDLKVSEFENAVAVLLRILTELAIGDYMDTTGKIKPLLDRADKQGKGRNWTPTLRQMLDELLKNDHDLVLNRHARKALQKAISDDDHPLSLDSLDQFVHNRYTGPSERELRQFWEMFQDLLQQMLNRQPTPAGGAN